MSFRVCLQKAEALGPVNRWYCAQAHGERIDDPDILMAYFVRSGGAANFAKKYLEAMGPLNRWYCSEYYRRDVSDPQTLWDYYIRRGKDGKREDPGDEAGDIAC